MKFIIKMFISSLVILSTSSVFAFGFSTDDGFFNTNDRYWKSNHRNNPPAVNYWQDNRRQNAYRDNWNRNDWYKDRYKDGWDNWDSWDRDDWDKWDKHKRPVPASNSYFNRNAPQCPACECNCNCNKTEKKTSTPVTSANEPQTQAPQESNQ